MTCETSVSGRKEINANAEERVRVRAKQHRRRLTVFYDIVSCFHLIYMLLDTNRNVQLERVTIIGSRLPGHSQLEVLR